MKNWYVVLLLFPLFISAQNNKPIGNFCIDNNSIIYRHVFKDSLDSAFVISKKLMSLLPASTTINNLKEFKSGVLITGTYESQSSNDGSPWEMVKGYFIIEIKNGKYRVSISNIIDNKNMPTVPFTYLYGKNTPLEWRIGAEKDLEKLDGKFTAGFELKNLMLNSNW